MDTTVIESPGQDLAEVLLAVQKLPRGGRVLSVYLDTSPVRVIGRGYLIAFHDACKALRARFTATDRDDERRFEAAAARVDDFLARRSSPGAPGLAIFVGEDGAVFAAPLPMRPADAVTWDERPAIEPIEATLDEFERVAVLLFDKERSRIFTVYLGEIEERQVLIDEVPGKQETGGWFALSQKRYERHHEDHVLRHARRTIRALVDELRARPFDRLFVGGPDEAVALLVQHLPRPLRGRLSGRLSLELFASDAEVLTATLAAAESAERREEVEAVEELIDGATTPNIALGLEATLGALTEGRVHRLFVAADLARDGAHCEVCGRVTASAGLCPACGSPTRPIADLREQAVELALAHGARVEIVAGLASVLLMRHGGLGARTRY